MKVSIKNCRTALATLALGALLGPSCATTQNGASSEVRSIDSIRELEQIPISARPVIKVSMSQDGADNVPEQYRWIMSFANKDKSVASGENLESKIRRALQQTGRFHVRATDFADVRQERDLEDEGLLSNESPTDIKIAKAQYSIRLNVEDFNLGESESGSDFGIGNIPFIGGAFDLGSQESTATCIISAEIINLSTGLVVNTVEGRGFQTSTSSKQRVSWGGMKYSQQEKENPTMANAVTECVKELVLEIGQSVPANNATGMVGTSVTAASSQHAPTASAGFCSECGQGRSQGTKFCGGCGSQLGD
ncbi:MAG: hypothetical protein ACI9F9_000310 [Candidatus Paceibacteria bacterium]|jgi:hypothetical protein